jgi:hypothetical protein
VNVWRELLEAAAAYLRLRGREETPRRRRWIATAAMCLMAAILSLWGVGLLIAALILLLLPHVGPAGAAAIAGGALLLLASLLALGSA